MTEQADTKLLIVLPSTRLWMVRNEIFKVKGFGQYILSTRVFLVPKPPPAAVGSVITMPGTRFESTGADGVWRYWWMYQPRPEDVADGMIDGIPEDWIIDHLKQRIGFRSLRPEPIRIRRIHT